MHLRVSRGVQVTIDSSVVLLSACIAAVVVPRRFLLPFSSFCTPDSLTSCVVCEGLLEPSRVHTAAHDDVCKLSSSALRRIPLLRRRHLASTPLDVESWTAARFQGSSEQPTPAAAMSGAPPPPPPPGFPQAFLPPVPPPWTEHRGASQVPLRWVELHELGTAVAAVSMIWERKLEYGDDVIFVPKLGLGRRGEGFYRADRRIRSLGMQDSWRMSLSRRARH